MRRVSPLFFLPIFFLGCAKQEVIEEISDPESTYERIRLFFDQRVTSIGELRCLGKLRFTGGLEFYVTLNYDSQGGVLEVFSPLRQKLGWMHFNPDTTTHSLEGSPELSDLGGYGFLIGWSAVGYPPFPADVQRLKLGKSRHSFHIWAKSEDLLYYFRILRDPMVIQFMRIKKEDSTVEVSFRSHRREGDHFFPYRITGSTSLGDFELRYLEIRTRE